MIALTVSASLQVSTLRVITWASGAFRAASPSEARARTISRSDRMPMTLRSGPSTTRAPIRRCANSAMAVSSVAFGSMVVTSRPLLDRIFFTVMGRLLDRKQPRAAGRPVSTIRTRLEVRRRTHSVPRIARKTLIAKVRATALGPTFGKASTWIGAGASAKSPHRVVTLLLIPLMVHHLAPDRTTQSPPGRPQNRQYGPPRRLAYRPRRESQRHLGQTKD